MQRILILERSPLVATDISETVRDALPGSQSFAVDSIEAAERALSEGSKIDICIVSGSSTRERLSRLAEFLDGQAIGTVTIGDASHDPAIFPPNAVHIEAPFTSASLREALDRVSSGGASPSQQ